MKKLILIVGFLALNIMVRAQSTNIQLTIKVTDATSTNTVTLNAPADYVKGFALAYAANVKANGTNAPTFPQFVKQEITDRLKGLQVEAVAEVLTQNKVALGAAQLATLWPTMTAQDQSTLSNLFKTYVP